MLQAPAFLWRYCQEYLYSYFQLLTFHVHEQLILLRWQRVSEQNQQLPDLHLSTLKYLLSSS